MRASSPPSLARAPRGRDLLFPILWAVLAQALLTAAVELEPPSRGEPLPWRWARVVADHPVRGTLAILLLSLGLCRRPGVGRAGGDREGVEEADPGVGAGRTPEAFEEAVESRRRSG